MYSVKVNDIGQVYSSESYSDALEYYQELKEKTKTDINSPYFGHNVHLFQDENLLFKKGGSVAPSIEKKSKAKFSDSDLVRYEGSDYRVIGVFTPLKRMGFEYIYDIENIYNGEVAKGVSEQSLMDLEDIYEARMMSANSMSDKAMAISDYAYAKLDSVKSYEILGDPIKQEKFLQIIQDRLNEFGIDSLSSDEYSIISDNNYHLLNQALDILGVYGETSRDNYFMVYSNSDWKSTLLNPYLKEIRDKQIHNLQNKIKFLDAYIKKVKSKKDATKLMMKKSFYEKKLKEVRVKYSKGGSVGSESEDTLFAFYVPMTDQYGNMVSEDEGNKRCAMVEDFLSEKTDSICTRSDESLGLEKYAKIIAHTKPRMIYSNEGDLIGKTREWCSMWNKTSMPIQIDSDIYYIELKGDKSDFDSHESISHLITSSSPITKDEENNKWGDMTQSELVSYGIGGKVIY